MPLRNGPHGYGAVTKALHWLIVFALVAQFVLGYGMEELSEWSTRSEEGDADEALVFLHGWVGGAILVLASVRLLWRRATALPPWAEQLSVLDRRAEHRVEQLLYLLLFVIPTTGLALLFLSGEEREVGVDAEWQPPYDLLDDDVLLSAHVGSQLLLYAAVAVHVGIAVRRRTVGRML